MDSGLAFDETEIELFDAFVRDYKSLIDDNTKSILITNDLGQSTKFKKYYIRITNTAIDYRQQDHNETNKYFLEFDSKQLLVNSQNASNKDFNVLLSMLKNVGQDLKEEKAFLFKEG